MTDNISRDKPVVVFWSEPNGLAINLVERLLMNFCRIKIVSNNIELWRIKLDHLPNKEAIQHLDKSEVGEIQNTEYLLINDYDLKNNLGELSEIVELSKTRFLKSLILFPYQITETLYKENLQKKISLLKKNNQEMGIIYLGDLLGPKIDYSETNIAGLIFLETVGGGEVDFPLENQAFFISPVIESAKEIVRALFSFGATGEGLAILGCQVEGDNFKTGLQRFYPQTVFRTAPSPERMVTVVEEMKNLGTNLDLLIKQTDDWFSTHPTIDLKEKAKTKLTEETVGEVQKVKRSAEIKKQAVKKDVAQPKFLGKYLKVFILLAVLVFIIPLTTLLIGVTTLVLSLKNLEKGDTAAAKTLISVSLGSSNLAMYEYQVLAKPPLVSYLFSPFLNYATVTGRSGKIVLKAVNIFEKGKYLGENLLRGEDFALTDTVRELVLDLDNLYDESGFIEGDIRSLSGNEQKIISSIIKIDQIGELRNKILYARDIVSQTPDLVGVEKQKTYLVLFQNNMELRPTGGFIGSFALITFDNGKISDFNVQDVYSADGQLKGHIEPPEPIKRYLGEASWFLRDSNWDPDFPTSATRAEWFLDKEIDKSVDGVVGIDLELAKNILKATGPIKLPDFGFEITDSNLYQKTQSEIEDNFFPGSTRKSTLLTAISKELLQRLLNLRKHEYLPVSRVFLQALEERSIQIMFHNKIAQKGISNLGFDGAIMEPVCLGNCYADWFGVVDANLGVNKANLFLERSFNLSLNLEKNILIRTLSISFKNAANTALGLKGRYKTYVRILLPLSASTKDVTIISGQETTTMPLEIVETKGRKEAGFLLEVSPSSEKTAEISWSSNKALNFSEMGEYRLYWRKQAGTTNDGVEISFAGFPKRVNYNPPFSLTQDGKYGYNTALARDLFLRVSW